MATKPRQGKRGNGSPAGKVTQADVARHAGVDRTTVSKILTDYPDDRFSEDTQRRVWAAARALGYKAQVRGGRRPRAAREVVNLNVALEVLRGRRGKVWARGRACLVNVSDTGGLLHNLEIPDATVPLERYYVRVHWVLDKTLGPRVGRLVRLDGGEEPGQQTGIAIRWME